MKFRPKILVGFVTCLWLSPMAMYVASTPLQAEEPLPLPIPNLPDAPKLPGNPAVGSGQAPVFSPVAGQVIPIQHLEPLPPPQAATEQKQTPLVIPQIAPMNSTPLVAPAPLPGTPAGMMPPVVESPRTDAMHTALKPVVNRGAQSGLPMQPCLSVKQSLPESVGPGQAVLAEITVTNIGGKNAENVVLTGWWTVGYELSQESVASQLINGRRAWGMGTLSVGESRTLQVRLTPSPNSPPTQEFRSGFDGTFTAGVSDTRSIKVTKPEIRLEMQASEQVFLGHSVPVQIRIQNPSSIPLKNVTIESTMSGALSHARGNRLVAEPFTIAPGASEVVPLDLKSLQAGEGRVQVRITADSADPVEKEIRITVMEARVKIVMHGPNSLFLNWPGTYEAVLENSGDQVLKDVRFEVKLPEGLKDLRASEKPGYDAMSHRIVWTFASLQPGEKRTMVWFGLAKQANDLTLTGTSLIGDTPIKRAEWTTRMLGPESK